MFGNSGTPKSTPSKDTNYVFRGMICYSEGGHYMAFFRRIFLKLAYVVGIDSPDFQKECSRLEDDLNATNEWVSYSDDQLKYVTDNWPAVIERCIEQSIYPTVLLYEKLHDEEDDIKYKTSEDFYMRPQLLKQIARSAI